MFPEAFEHMKENLGGLRGTQSTAEDKKFDRKVEENEEVKVVTIEPSGDESFSWHLNGQQTKVVMNSEVELLKHTPNNAQVAAAESNGLPEYGSGREKDLYRYGTGRDLAPLMASDAYSGLQALHSYASVFQKQEKLSPGVGLPEYRQALDTNYRKRFIDVLAIESNHVQDFDLDRAESQDDLCVVECSTAGAHNSDSRLLHRHVHHVVTAERDGKSGEVHNTR
ncbi:hypothetical protein SUGI_0645420 [Cryptomeria japonica]|nr:hypothetical protein SUGI_0645420 [Cryptomeria japonica]